MRRRLILLALPVAALGGLVVASGHVATAATRTAVPNVSGTFTDKPYTATTPDSGTTGNNWAIDLFTRDFVVHPTNQDGTTTVTEHFNNGRFITLGDGNTGSAASPGQTDPGNASHMLKEGVSGTFSGTFTIVVNAGHPYVSGGGCGQVVSGNSTDDGCTAALWISHNFSGAVYGTDTTTTHYSLTYKALGNAVLGTKTWTDADAGSGGDTGDIYTS
jgi:hypothetical protein